MGIALSTRLRSSELRFCVKKAEKSGQLRLSCWCSHFVDRLSAYEWSNANKRIYDYKYGL